MKNIPFLVLLQLTFFGSVFAYDVYFFSSEDPTQEPFVCSDLASLQYTAPDPSSNVSGVLSLRFPGGCYDNSTPRPNPNVIIHVVGGGISEPVNLTHGSFITAPLPPAPFEIVSQGVHGTARIINSHYAVYEADPATEALSDAFSFRMRDSTNDALRPWSEPVSVTVHIDAGGL